MYKHEEILEELLGIDIEINFTLFKKIQFNDTRLENKFLIDYKIKEKQRKVFSDLILLVGYIIVLLFLILYKKCHLINILYLLFLFSTIIIIILSYFIQNENIKRYLDYVLILIFSLNMNVKVIILTFLLKEIHLNKEFETETELFSYILREIIYNFIITNFLLMLKLDGNFISQLFFSVLIFTSILILNIKLRKGIFF